MSLPWKVTLLISSDLWPALKCLLMPEETLLQMQRCSQSNNFSKRLEGSTILQITFSTSLNHLKISTQTDFKKLSLCIITVDSLKWILQALLTWPQWVDSVAIMSWILILILLMTLIRWPKLLGLIKLQEISEGMGPSLKAYLLNEI